MMPPLAQIGSFLDNHIPAHEISYTRAPSVSTDKIRQAIALNETQGVPDPYTFSRYSGSKIDGRAMGKYQVTEGELKTYAKRYLGTQIAPQQFNASPGLQETYMTNKINNLVKQGYTPHQIADIHKEGIKNTGDPGSKVYQNPNYVATFNKNYTGLTSPRTIGALNQTAAAAASQ